MHKAWLLIYNWIAEAKNLLMLPCSDWKEKLPHFSPFCPLSSSVHLSFYLWSYISDFMIVFCCSTYTHIHRGQKVLGFLWQKKERSVLKVRRQNCVQAESGALSSVEHLLASNVASKAACYLDCISLCDASALTRLTSVNKIAPVLERVRASALCLLTKRTRR